VSKKKMPPGGFMRPNEKKLSDRERERALLSLHPSALPRSGSRSLQRLVRR